MSAHASIIPTLPPHNIEAEMAVLGAVLSNNDALLSINEFLRADHFFDPVHQRIYEVVVALAERGQIASPVALKAYFSDQGGLAQVGGQAYLARLVGAQGAIFETEFYGRQILDLATRRSVQDICLDAVESAQNLSPDQDAESLVGWIEGRIFELDSGGPRSRLASFADAADEVIDGINPDGQPPGIPTGLRDWDKNTGGLHPSDMIIVAGRPSMGKTALATNVAFNVANSVPVLFFTIEMSRRQLATRILSDLAGVPADLFRKGRLTDDQIRALVEAKQRFYELPLHIEDRQGITISDIRNIARRAKAKQGIGLVVVDYLQRVRPEDRYRGNKVAEVSEASSRLKDLAKELDIPVMVLSQLSRAVEQREDKRPQLSDLRDSGSIEQDADVVTFVYREEYYLSKSAPPITDRDAYADWTAQMREVRGLAEIFCRKDRNGATWEEKFHFSGDFCRFTDLRQ